jgi:uncharacterized protein
MKGCGACCFLGDYDVDTLQELLKTADDVAKYVGMIGSDGWCTHFDKEQRNCSVYERRPPFCRVEFDVFNSLYGVEDEAEMNAFAIECCEHHIGQIFPALEEDSSESRELQQYRELVAGARGGDVTEAP